MPPVTSDEYDLELLLEVGAGSCVRHFSIGVFSLPLKVMFLVYYLSQAFLI